MAKTVQLGIRIEEGLVRRIEELAKGEGIDRNMWIKRALEEFVDKEEEGMIDQAIESYIQLRIDKDELLRWTNMKKVPKDIDKAREGVLKKIQRR